jgi:hypothetical protein
MRKPTHVITSQGQHFGEVGHIIAGANNLVKVHFLIHSTKQTVFIRRNALLPLNPCDTTNQEVNVSQIEREAVNKVLEELINDIAKDSAEFESHKTDAAQWYVKGMTHAMQLASSKLNIKLS